MTFALGVVLFALGVAVSVALHEAGHLWAARRLGMKVRRFSLGRGPMLFSVRRGETDYGLGLIPVGGFCEIAGTTALDELTPDEYDRALYRQKTWKRLVVMSGGIGMNFLLAGVLVLVLAVGWGLPELHPKVVVESVGCVPSSQRPGPGYGLAACDGPGPAGAAGILPGDAILAVDGEGVTRFGDLVGKIWDSAGVVELTIERHGRRLVLPVATEQVQRWVVDPRTGDERSTAVGAIGVSARPPAGPVRYDVVTAVPAALAFTGDLAALTARTVVDMPTKAASLWRSVTGGERDADTPISVVGAGSLGGRAVERGAWESFVLLLVSLNLFVGLFNLLPLLPLDGGHMAVAIYEGLRNRVRARLGRPGGAPVDFVKLLPVTYAFVVVGGAFMLLTLAADIVAPVRPA
ncbi:RIP metalloprotease [Rhodococcus aetherivorans]|uniref:M50 family metallopeptidase n=1 Tax=Rhodococcus aetherivorans TaxID=191292 RepID=UPI0002D23EEC|nr:site-2 protease family protein [Rhodococcus aetherivorans]AKE88255.1 zinc metalloprotease [Rhodococcus aetherivorans]UGQ40910.1 site-2 protease family protein [Rhodococcus aetherivorans]CCW13964.1 possible membrane-associated Zn-dependent protease [Rhodococcus aetherivorans]